MSEPSKSRKKGTASRLLHTAKAAAATPAGRKILFRGALVLAFLVASMGVRARVTARKDLRISPQNIRVSEPPSWLDPDSLSAMKRVPWLAKEGISVFEPGLAQNMAWHFASLPFVSKVHRVEVALPHEVRFEVDLRVPYCFLDMPAGRIAMDREGTVLPAQYYPPERLAVLGRLPVVSGIKPRTRLREGVRLTDLPFQHARSVLDLLEAEGLLPRLEGLRIDVSGVPPDDGYPARPGPEIVLEVDGARLLWGRSPISPHLKYPASEKLALLRRLLETRTLASGNTYQLYDGRILEGRP